MDGWETIFHHELWQKLIDIDLLKYNISSEYDGEGLGHLDTMIVSEEIRKAYLSVG